MSSDATIFKHALTHANRHIRTHPHAHTVSHSRPNPLKHTDARTHIHTPAQAHAHARTNLPFHTAHITEYTHCSCWCASIKLREYWCLSIPGCVLIAARGVIRVHQELSVPELQLFYEVRCGGGVYRTLYHVSISNICRNLDTRVLSFCKEYIHYVNYILPIVLNIYQKRLKSYS